jgi:hypothetical protein
VIWLASQHVLAHPRSNATEPRAMAMPIVP